MKSSTYLHDSSNGIDDYQKVISTLKKEDFFSKLKNTCPIDEKIEKTKKKIIEIIVNKKGEQLTNYLIYT